MFILTAYLKGYKREHIKIDINDDGSRIAIIRGEVPDQEVVTPNYWYRNEIVTEWRRFKKAFKIPDEVFLDKIKARFSQADSFLTISMPKSVKGIHGKTVEEVKEGQEEFVRGRFSRRSLQISDNGEPDTEEDIKESDPSVEKLPPVSEELASEKIEQASGGGGEIPSLEVQERSPIPPSVDKVQLGVEEHDQIPPAESKMRQKESEVQGKTENDVKEEEVEERAHDAVTGTDKSKPPEKRSNLCVPMIAGSAFLVSIIVLVIQFVRTKIHLPNRETRD